VHLYDTNLLRDLDEAMRGQDRDQHDHPEDGASLAA
jgi:hypothetical protein